MIEVRDRVRRRRQALGLTQSDVARRAGVSLATVQNIEAGRANPSLSTLTGVLSCLGLAVRVEPEPADWDALVALGLPMQGASRPLSRRDAETLRFHLGRAAVELAESGAASDAAGDPAGANARRAECVRALLLALVTHYPSVARTWLPAAPAVRSLVPATPSGREIKLGRIARARLAEYL